MSESESNPNPIRIQSESESNAHDPDEDERQIDPVFAYATENLTYMTGNHMEELADFRADMGDDLCIYAIDEACALGGRSWAYARKVLAGLQAAGIKTVGEAKAAKERRQKTAQPQGGKPIEGRQYSQRDYSAKDDEFKTMTLEELGVAE